ncbi:amino acid/amide ABC transporter ATP-binding protein 2, HAAT family (TC 3.A.1.4.-) [Maridesulfovibrio ferrireducens]|uniref:Amino acid/amide ABC transporter ATP-binding protein 2, HAAT family (TC 3.A.1.4.-) n=1 Tax=Maridesulfovibrio ferrireducens TaxID=246191 RepID=A0A1G9KPZ8_9BACT|nr:ABC transporter ATP-binding protein [Maridesulfovibrio ferrireducens]SDL51573.1 amino acid/amide ABC transporter ATP-binding protein 2, HAAT family (TC 3.A.1.4.-) [Maridesulfovibrio ferrireducens]
MSLLNVQNLEVVYNDVVLVLKGLSLNVAKGSITTLLGANGAGKSTTLKAISGLLEGEDGKATSGTILYKGQPMSSKSPEKTVRQGIFQVMEGRRIFEDLTVEENLRCGAYTQPAKNFSGNLEKVYTYFPRLRERKAQLAGYMSGGEQQMLAIGRAVMASPELLLLDEPSLGLAPLLVEEIFDIVKKINKEEGVTVLLVEQNARMALSLADYGYIMENGRIVMDGKGSELLHNPDVQEFYLGLSHGGEKRSYRDVKHYRRRKRWLG